MRMVKYWFAYSNFDWVAVKFANYIQFILVICITYW